MKTTLYITLTFFLSIHIHAQSIDKKIRVGTDVYNVVNTVLQLGDTLYVGGSFNKAGYEAQHLARFNGDSTKPDFSFPGLGGSVRVIEPDGNGGYYAGGSFGDFNGIPIPGTSIIHILKDGTRDENFAAVNLGTDLRSLKKYKNILYIGGDFAAVQNHSRPKIAALNAVTGALLNWVPPAPNHEVDRIEATDSLVLISGSFSFVGGLLQQNGFCALSANTGNVIQNFPRGDDGISFFQVNDNKLIVAGPFNNIGYYVEGICKVDTGTARPDFYFPILMGNDTTGRIYCILPDNKGGYYVGGDFSVIGGVGAHYIAHILASGKVDTRFHAIVNAPVRCMASDERNLYIGGDFTGVDQQPRTYAASVKLSDGSLSNFNPSANGRVLTICYHNNIVYLGGEFSSLWDVSRNHAGALIANTVVLTDWNPDVNGTVTQILPAGNSIFLCGDFTTVKNLSMPYLCKVDSNANVYSSWKPTPDKPVHRMAADSNRLYVCGLFSSIDNKSRKYLACIDISSGRPTSFHADLDNEAADLCISDKKLYVAGNFTSAQNKFRKYICRIDLATNKLDNWNADNEVDPNYQLYAVNVTGSKVLIGGGFTYLKSTNKNHLAVLDLSANDYSVTKWSPSVSNFDVSVITSTLKYNHDIIALGYFSYNYKNGKMMRGMISLNDTSGEVSRNFNFYVESGINVGAIHNNKLLVAGDYVGLQSVSSDSIAYRTNVSSFNLSTNKLNEDLYEPDFPLTGMISDSGANKLLFAGDFTLFNCVRRVGLLSVNLNTGELTSFNPEVNGEVFTLAAKDSILFVGGNFSYISNNQRSFLAAVNIKTNTVTPWNTGLNSIVMNLAIKDTFLYAAGRFTMVNGLQRNYLASFSVKTAALTQWNPAVNNQVYSILPVDNKVYIGGIFTNVKGVTKNYLAKCNNTDGTPDRWSPNPDAGISSIAVANDMVYVGGGFKTISHNRRPALAAFDKKTNTLSSFSPQLKGYNNVLSVSSVTATSHTVYIASPELTAINNQSCGRMIGIDAATQTFSGFDPRPYAQQYFKLNLTLGNERLLAVGFNHFYSLLAPYGFATFFLDSTMHPSNYSRSAQTQKTYLANNISAEQKFNITVLPNPVTANATLLVKGAKGDIHISVSNENGKIVWSAFCKTDMPIQIPSTNFSAGVYFLSAENAGEVVTLKLLKK